MVDLKMLTTINRKAEIADMYTRKMVEGMLPSRYSKDYMSNPIEYSILNQMSEEHDPKHYDQLGRRLETIHEECHDYYLQFHDCDITNMDLVQLSKFVCNIIAEFKKDFADHKFKSYMIYEDVYNCISDIIEDDSVKAILLNTVNRLLNEKGYNKELILKQNEKFDKYNPGYNPNEKMKEINKAIDDEISEVNGVK